MLHYLDEILSVPSTEYLVLNSNVVTITVDPTPIISGTLTSDQPSNTVCSDDTGMIVFTASPGGASSYDFWFK